MRTIPAIRLRLASLAVVLCGALSASAQITINELIVNERDYDGNVADNGEFVELYNAGGSAVDLSGWAIVTTNLANGATDNTYTLPNGTSIAPGGYFVVGQAGVPNVNYTPAAGALWTDGAARVLELRNDSAATIDAVAYEVFRTSATGLSQATAAQLAQIGSGYQGQLFSFVSPVSDFPNEKTAFARYRDGRDNSSTGRDFGHMPMTPGTTNNILPMSAKHTIPNADALGVGSALTEYNGSFVVPKVINPASPDANHFRFLPESPQKGNAIIAWDPVGGGNTSYSEELVTSFDLYAYFDTSNLAIPVTDEQYELSVYGIGTGDARYATADPRGAIPAVGAVTENSNTGLGWYFERWKSVNSTDFSTKLMLIDFGDGGNSDPSAGEWNVIQTIDMSLLPSDWYRLSIDYNPATGDVTARFNDQTYDFNAGTQVMGTFYVGYREQVTNLYLDLVNPPVFDNVVQPGDFDADGDVDGADFVAWQTNFPKASGATLAEGDADGDGDVDGADFVVWQTNFPFTPSPGASPVPEPATVLLAGICTVVLGIRRLRRT